VYLLVGELIVEALCQHGQLTFRQVKDLCLNDERFKARYGLLA